MKRTVWRSEWDDELRKLSGMQSFAQQVASINRKFGTSFTRNAVLGRVRRMGLRPVLLRAKPKPKPKPKRRRVLRPFVFVAREADVTPRGVSILALESADCRYPFGDQEFTFCGNPTLDGGSYCAAHFRLCHRSP